jgi:hypothetical protein
MTGPAVSIKDNVGAALRFARENWRYVLTVALLGSIALTIVSGLALLAPALGILGTLSALFARAVICAALIGAVLFGAAAVRARLWQDAARVLAAMAIVGFFLFIVTFVLFIPGGVVLAAGPLTPYVDELQAAGGDQAGVMAIMLRFAQENVITVVLLVLFYSTVWLVLTSRLYLAAPASVDQGRILTFETWAWTKGATLRIIAARLLLLLPAFVLVNAIDYVVGALVGINPYDAAAVETLARTNLALLLGYAFVTTFVTTVVYSSLEAGLSTNLYRDLKQAAPPKASN